MNKKKATRAMPSKLSDWERGFYVGWNNGKGDTLHILKGEK